MEDARTLARAYVAAFAQANRFLIPDQEHLVGGRRCFTWAEIIYGAVKNLGLTSFTVDWVAKAGYEDGEYAIQHNFVRIGFSGYEAETGTRSAAHSCEVVLDPWLKSAPKAFYHGTSTGREAIHDWNHIVDPALDRRIPNSLGMGKKWDESIGDWVPWGGWDRNENWYDHVYDWLGF